MPIILLIFKLQVKTQLLRFVDALQKGSCGPLDNSKMGDVSMVTFGESEYGPGKERQN